MDGADRSKDISIKAIVATFKNGKTEVEPISDNCTQLSIPNIVNWSEFHLGTPPLHVQQHNSCAAAIAIVSFIPVVLVTLSYLWYFTDMNKQVFTYKVCEVSDIQLIQNFTTYWGQEITKLHNIRKWYYNVSSWPFETDYKYGLFNQNILWSFPVVPPLFRNY